MPLFRRNNTTINESLPFRLSNLVANAKLDLAPRRNSKGSSSSGKIKIKMTVIDLPPSFSESLVGEFLNSTTIWQILKHFEKKSGINFTQRSVAVSSPNSSSGKLKYEIASVHLFNRTISKLEDLNNPLSALGFVSGNASIKVRFNITDMAYEEALEIHKGFLGESESKEKNEVNSNFALRPPNESSSITSVSENSIEVSSEAQIVTDNLSQIDTDVAELETLPAEPTESSSALSHDLSPITINSTATSSSRNIQVYLPDSDVDSPSIRFDNTIIEEDQPEMSKLQFVHYHAQLKAMSVGNSNRPLMTKALRESAEAQKQAKITHFVVRVRLPDQSHVEATFLSSDKASSIYDFVISVLRDDIATPFFLFVTPPKKRLDPQLSLLKDYKFGQRNLVYLEWESPQTYSTPLLKPEFLSKAKTILEDPGIKQDQSQIQNDKDSNEPAKPLKKPGFSGTPKWLKVGRK